MGLIHQATTVNPVKQSEYRLLLASRYPFTQQHIDGILRDTGRWLHVKLTEPQSLDVIVLHVQTRDAGNKFQFQDAVIVAFHTLSGCNAVAFGDRNTGEPSLDEEAKFFNSREADWFDQIRKFGWLDVWRHRKPRAREYIRSASLQAALGRDNNHLHEFEIGSVQFSQSSRTVTFRFGIRGCQANRLIHQGTASASAA